MSTPEERAFLIAQDAKDSATTDIHGDICGLDWLAYAIATAIREAEARALERAAKVAKQFTDADWIAHDMRTGEFPKRSRMQDAIAAAIRAALEKKP